MSSHFLELSDEDLLAEASRLLTNFSQTSLTILQGDKLSLSSRVYLASQLIRATSSGEPRPTSVSFEEDKLRRVVKVPEMRPWNDPSEEQALTNYLNIYEDELREQILNQYNALIVRIYPDPDRLALFRSDPATYGSAGLAMLAEIEFRAKDTTTPSVDDESEITPGIANVDVREGIAVRDVEPQNTGWLRPAQVAAGADWAEATSVVEEFGEGQAKDVVAAAFGGYLTLQDLGIEIPDGATVLGIEIEVMRSFFGSGIENLDEEIDVVQCRREYQPQPGFVYIAQNNNPDYSVYKFGPDGEQDFAINVGVKIACRVALDSQGSIYVAENGVRFVDGVGSRIHIGKYDIEGNLLWLEYEFGGGIVSPAGDGFYDVTNAVAPGDYDKDDLIIGFDQSVNGVMRISPEGGLRWRTSGGLFVPGRRIIPDEEENFYLLGKGGTTAVSIAELRDTGTGVWNNSIGFDNTYDEIAFAADIAGGFLYVNNESLIGEDFGPDPIAIAKYDVSSNGAYVESFSLGGVVSDLHIAVKSNGNILVAHSGTNGDIQELDKDDGSLVATIDTGDSNTITDLKAGDGLIVACKGISKTLVYDENYVLQWSANVGGFITIGNG